MKKYFPAKGVVDLEWKEGFPQGFEGTTYILAEIWTVGMLTGWKKSNGSQISVRAQLIPFKWSHNTGVYVSLWDNTTTYPEERWRRWASLGSRYTHVPVNLDTWR